jgi:N-acetylmuramoyl-L-alanine amidase
MNSTANNPSSKNSNGKFLWILDNGHGVDTPGKRSPMLTDGRQFREYLFNREVVTMMISMIEELGLRAHRLVPEDNDIPLSTRVARANKLNKTTICVLVSIHSNAYGDGWRFTSPRGIETYYYESSEGGMRIAGMFQENLIQVTGWKDRGVRRGDFQILRDTHMPAVLTENGFYTNREQLEYLLDPDWRTTIAEAHVEAIKEIEEMGPQFFQS